MLRDVNSSVCFYGRFAGTTRKDLEREARARGWKVATSLRASVDAIVIGEDEPLEVARARLAEEFDAASRDAFVSGALEIVTESEFLARLRGESQARESMPDATPATAAAFVGVSVATIRRWIARGFLRYERKDDRLPTLPAREIFVARRLAFLRSTNLSEDFIAKRVATFAALAASEAESKREEKEVARDLLAFAREPENVDRVKIDARDLTTGEFDVGAVIARTTLTVDGKDLLFFLDPATSEPPIDARGQRRFEFVVAPPDGIFDAPTEPTPLSEEEESLLVAERLRQWNANETAATGRPAFLDLFRADSPLDAARLDDAALEPAALEPASLAHESGDPAAFDVSLDRSEPAVLEFPHSEPVGASSTRFYDATAADLTRFHAVAREERERERAAASRRVVALCEQAWNLEKEGYWEESARAYRSAALVGGADPEVSYRLGKALFLLGDYCGARERFFTALELDGGFARAKAELGKTFVALGAPEDARAAFASALVDVPDDPELRIEYGKLLLTLGARDAAEREFKAAEKLIDDPRLVDDLRRLFSSLAERTDA